MFGLKLKDKYRYKEYILMDEENGELCGKITYSEEDIIRNIILWPTILAVFVATGFDNIYIGFILGTIYLLYILYSAFEKVDDKY